MEESTAIEWQQAMQQYPQSYPRLLSTRFPHVLEKIVMAWPQPGLARACFDELLLTQRERREGWPSEIYSEIFALERLYDQINQPPRDAFDHYWSWVSP